MIIFKLFWCQRSYLSNHSILGVDGDTAADVDHHLELGKKLLAAGQLTEALSHYHAAVGMYLYYIMCQICLDFDVQSLTCRNPTRGMGIHF